MRKISILAILFAMFVGISFAQTASVIVVKNNGETVEYNASDIAKIVFDKTNTDVEITPGEAVDLGLSVKWASCNLGANAPEGFGNYYAWGETEPKSVYSENTYKWWDPEWGYHYLGANITETIYDAAYVNLGEGWRMPTYDEWRELVGYCTTEWTSVNGHKGYLVTGKNGNSIFLPAAGRLYDVDGEEQNNRENISGFYWEANVAEYDENNYRARRVSFESTDLSVSDMGGDSPFIGMSIRPVYGALLDTDPEPEPGPMNMVDLALPSGKKWAAHNVGAANEGEAGNYYSWGVCRTQESYGDPSYKHNLGTATDDKGMDYNIYADLGTDIAGTKYDVATVRWGEGWRMPNRTEFQELIDNCTWTYRTKGGARGWEVTGTNGNSIFFPMKGYAGVEGVICDVPGDILPFQGFYATSEEKPTVIYPYPTSCFILKLKDNSYKIDDTFKSLGVLVRPIHD